MGSKAKAKKKKLAISADLAASDLEWLKKKRERGGEFKVKSETPGFITPAPAAGTSNSSTPKTVPAPKSYVVVEIVQVKRPDKDASTIGKLTLPLLPEESSGSSVDIQLPSQANGSELSGSPVGMMDLTSTAQERPLVLPTAGLNDPGSELPPPPQPTRNLTGDVPTSKIVTSDEPVSVDVPSRPISESTPATDGLVMSDPHETTTPKSNVRAEDNMDITPSLVSERKTQTYVTSLSLEMQPPAANMDVNNVPAMPSTPQFIPEVNADSSRAPLPSDTDVIESETKLDEAPSEKVGQNIFPPLAALKYSSRKRGCYSPNRRKKNMPTGPQLM